MLFSAPLWAAEAETAGGALDLTGHDLGIAALLLFLIALTWCTKNLIVKLKCQLSLNGQRNNTNSMSGILFTRTSVPGMINLLPI